MVQLLVSVRSAGEVEPALAGGADIIDAKEPSRGSLGPVARHELTRILASVPDEHPVSIALGDFTASEQVEAALVGLVVPERTAPVYLKLGFAGVRSPARIRKLIETGARLAPQVSERTRLIAVAYADADPAETVAPERVLQLAGTAGAVGLLLDTQVKDGRRLVDWLDPVALRDWVAAARGCGLMVAFAGSLKSTDLAHISELEPDVVGVRGAACEGGREGWVTANRVSVLRKSLVECSRNA